MESFGQDWDDENGENFLPTKQLKESLNLRELEEKGSVFEVNEVLEEKELEESENFKSIPDFFEDDTDESGNELEQFDRMAKKMVDISGKGKVLKKVKQEGVGVRVPTGAHVLYHYSLYLEYADEPFDSSLSRKPARTNLSKGEVIPGLTIALQSMRKQERSMFLIHYEFAFGLMGVPPRIPRAAPVLADITLVDYLDSSAADAYDEMTEEEKGQTTFEEKRLASVAYQRKATDFFKKGHMHRARNHYYKILNVMGSCIVKNEEEEKVQMEMMFRAHANLAQVFLELHQPAKTCSECQEALDLPIRDPEDIADIKAKLYYRFGKAKMLLDDYRSARRYLLLAQKLNPNNNDVAKMLLMVADKEEKYAKREAMMCKNMFKTHSMSQQTVQFPGVVNKNAEQLVLDIDGLEVVLNPESMASDGQIKEEHVEDSQDLENSNDTRQKIDGAADKDSTKDTPSSALPDSFESLFREQIRQFVEDDMQVQISLPPGLSKQNAKLATRIAEDRGLIVESTDTGARSHLIIHKLASYDR